MTDYARIDNISINASQLAFLRDKYYITLPGGTYSVNPDFTIEGPAMLGGNIQSHWPGEFGCFSYSWSPLSRYVATIGRYCSLASNITFGDWEHHVDWLTTSNVVWDAQHPSQDFMRARGNQYKFVQDPNHGDMRKILIGNDVWIGSNVYIRQGVRIGDGAIIGRGTNVTRDVPPYAIFAGNPGRIKRYRFSEMLIERMIAFKWWRFCFADFNGIDCSDPYRSLDALQSYEDTKTIIPFEPIRLTISEIACLNINN